MRIKKLAKLFNSYQRQLYVCAIAITKNRESAEDAVHDALIAVSETPNEPLDLKSYLFKTVRTKALYIHQRNNRQPPQLSAFIEVDQLSHDDRYFYSQALKCMDTLEPDQQHVLIMKLLGDLTFKEIAEYSSTSINTIASRYRRGLIALQEKLNE